MDEPWTAVAFRVVRPSRPRIMTPSFVGSMRPKVSSMMVFVSFDIRLPTYTSKPQPVEHLHASATPGAIHASKATNPSVLFMFRLPLCGDVTSRLSQVVQRALRDARVPDPEQRLSLARLRTVSGERCGGRRAREHRGDGEYLSIHIEVLLWFMGLFGL